MDQELEAGIVGCGGIARAHLAAYRQNGVKVAWVYDPNPDAAESFAEQAQNALIAASPDTMASKDKIDVVSICSPPAAHVDNARPFLEAGIPVLCEKPLGLNAKDASLLKKAAQDSETLLMTAFCHRFHPPIVALKKLIEEGVFGRPLFFRNLFGGYLDLAGNHRIKPEISGGGCLIDHCAHSVDLFRHLVGEPTHVQALGGNIMQEQPIEDFGMIHLAAGERAYGEIAASYSLPICSNSIEFYGTEGTAIVSYFDATRPELAYRLKSSAEWVEHNYSGEADRFTAEIAHFLDCVQYNRQPCVTAEDGVRSNALADAIYKSVRSSVRITV